MIDGEKAKVQLFSKSTLSSLLEVFHSKSDVISTFGLSCLFAAYFRALVGATTFQTSIEIGFLVVSCIVLFAGLQVICVVDSLAFQSLIMPIAILVGAIIDWLVGLKMGRTSTPALTLILLVAGCAMVGVIHIKHLRTANEEWRENRVACSYDALAFPLVYLALFILFLGLILGCLFIVHVGGLNKGISQLGFFVGCSIAGLLIGCIMLMNLKHRFQVLAKVALLFIIAGLSLMLLIEPSFLSLMVLAIGFCCFFHLSLSATFFYYNHFSLPRLFVIGYLFLLFLAILIGLLSGNLLLLSNSIGEVSTFTIVSMLVINVISVVGLGARSSWNIESLLDSPRDGKAEEGCYVPGLWTATTTEIAAEFSLTKREQEVFSLIAKGRNASHIEKELVISNHTARAHILNIYRKLNLHSQQAVIDYVELRVLQKKKDATFRPF